VRPEDLCRALPCARRVLESQRVSQGAAPICRDAADPLKTRSFYAEGVIRATVS
jgi:hypothetical protein